MAHEEGAGVCRLPSAKIAPLVLTCRHHARGTFAQSERGARRVLGCGGRLLCGLAVLGTSSAPSENHHWIIWDRRIRLPAAYESSRSARMDSMRLTVFLPASVRGLITS